MGDVGSTGSSAPRARIRLGDTVRDRVNQDVSGLVIARIEHLYRSPEVKIARRVSDSDGKPYEELWLDESRLEVLE